MNTVVFSNNAETYIVKNVGLDDTTLSVVDGGMVRFPKLETGDYFYARIIHADDASITEYVKVIGIDGDTLTVQRGIDSTTPTQFPVNSRLRHTLSESGLYDVQTLSRITRKHDSDTSEYGSGDGMQYGHVKLSDDFDTGEQAIDGVVCTPKALREAVRRLTALPKEELFTTSTTWTCPETGLYTITCVGGGGTGGTGGAAVYAVGYETGNHENCSSNACTIVLSGGGGGGGGAGQTTTKNVLCTKGTVYSITVGGPAGTTTFGSNHVVGVAGGTGGTGGVGAVSAYTAPSCGTCCNCSTSLVRMSYGGAGGTSYGSTPGTGGSGILKQGSSWPCGNNFAGGGSGAVSTFGSGFGTGGTGGRSGGQADHYRCYLNIAGPAGGSAGTQGCIKIVYPLGK